MKKTIVLLILTVLLLSMLAGCDMGADKPNPASDFEYEISESKTGVIIYKYIGTSENVVIPAEIEGLPVRTLSAVFSEDGSLESGVFEGSNIKSIVFPNTVFTIGYNTCKDCTALTSVTFAENSELTQIALSAFEGCTALKEITLPNTVTEIQARAFYGCSALTEVDLPDELTKIGGSAFSECAALKKITIPAKLDLNFLNMGDSPLTLVPSLEQIVFEEGREAIRGIGLINGSCDIEITVPKSVKEFSSYPFYIGRDSKSEIIFLGDAPEIVEEGNENFGVSVIYYDSETSGWDTFAWKDLYEMKPIED
ncbi:MAG: leucine-rich repeat domain-containing protein [Ruminococcaceae bacterium]|nr:leucine-rich repeat domain-containing protein [Oscillospiraceae bacterium]